MRVKHGMFGSKAYSTWNSMVMRCHNPNAQAYPNYGARGIMVCEQWRTFEHFYADMGEPDGRTLDRIDNSLGYSKDNCRWASMKTQQNNKRSNVILEYAGYKRTVTQWAEQLSIPRGVLYDRLRAGWEVGRVLSTPKKKVKARKAGH